MSVVKEAMMLMMKMRENERFPRLLIYRGEMRAETGGEHAMGPSS